MTAPTPSFATPCTTSCWALAQTLHRPTVPSAQPRVRGRPSTAVRFPIFPRQGPQRPTGYILPHSSQQNRAGNRFPWPAARGFCTPRRQSRLCRRSAHPQPPSADQIRPLGLHSRGLGVALWRLRDDLREQRIFTRHSYYMLRPHHFCVCTWGPHTRETFPRMSLPQCPIRTVLDFFEHLRR